MKKRFILFTFFAFFLMISSTKADISYDITDMNVNNSTISFKGWAIRVGTNNFGGKTSEIIMEAVGSEPNKSVVVNATLDADGVSNNFYPVMCVNYSGKPFGSNQAGTGLCKKERVSSCSAGDCLYRRIKFSASFNISELKELGNNIRFRIIIKYNLGLNGNLNSSIIDGGVYDKPDSESKFIGVYSFNCKINGRECQVGDNAMSYGGDSNLTLHISNVSNTANVIQSNAKIQRENGSYFSKISDVCKLVYHSNIQLLGRTSREMNYMYARYFDDATNFQMWGYKVSTKNFGVTGCGGTSYNSGYAYGSWLEVDKELILNFNGTPPPDTCQSNKDLFLVCKNGSFEISCDDSVTIGLSKYLKDGSCSGTGYANITAKYHINQTGDLIFNLDRGPVYSGGSFTFNASYTNNANWYYVGTPDACPLITIPNADETTCCSEDECHKCCQDAYAYADNCRGNTDDNKVLYERKIAERYAGTELKKPSSNPKNMIVTLPDSNDVKAPGTTIPGVWDCSNIKSFSSNERWEENQELIVKCTYQLKDAYIDRTTSNVVYGSVENPSNYLFEGKRYFVPLKWNDSKFNIVADFNNLSSIKNISWQGQYTCDVECQQRLYNMPPGLNGNDFYGMVRGDNTPGLYVYYYRPISLSVPFPDRDAGSNWIDWISDSSNIARLKNTYNNKEYRMDLSLSDLNYIKNEYNKSKLEFEGRGYLDYSVNIEGVSSFISNNVGDFASRFNPTHSRLGEFNE